MSYSKQKITHITFLSQILLNRLSDKIADNNFRAGLKYSAQKFVTQLEMVESKRFDKLFNHNEKASDQIYKLIDDFYLECSKVDIEKMPAATLVLTLLNEKPEFLENLMNQLLESKEDEKNS